MTRRAAARAPGLARTGLASMAAAAMAALCAAAPARATPDCGEVEVRAGQTLTGIAAAGEVGVEALYDANRDRLSSPDRIEAGQRLRLPCPEDATAPATEEAAPVEPSDTHAPAPEAEPETKTAGPGAPPQARPADTAPTPPPAARPAELAPAPEPGPSDALLPVMELAAPPANLAPDQTADLSAGPPAPAEAAVALARAALAAAVPDRPLDPARATAGAASLGALDPTGPALLAYPVWWPDCAALSRLPPAAAALCARFDASRPLATLRMIWFARAGAMPADAAPPPGARVCRAAGRPDVDLAALGLAPPRAARLTPATDADCLRMVETGEADYASLPALALSRALEGVAHTAPGLERRPELERTLALRAVARSGSAAGRAALAALDEGLERLARD